MILDVLKGEFLFEPDYIIFSCHGDEGKFFMPVLGETIYMPDEPRGNFGADEVRKYLELIKDLSRGLSPKFIKKLQCGSRQTPAFYNHLINK